MTEITVECIPFKKGTITQEEIDLFRETHDESYAEELKTEIQKIFKFGGIEINPDEIFQE